MGWGTELWDRLEAVEGHTAEGIAFITHVRTLAAKVSEVEKEYASKLAAVVNAAPPSSNMAGTSFDSAWKAVLGSVGERAKQHEAVSTTLMAEVCQPLKLLIKETTQKRQDNLKEVATQRAELAKHVAAFDKRRKVYDKVEKEAERAKVILKKYEENPAQQKKVDPSRREFAKKAIGREEAERVLEQDLSTLNRERIVHYYTTMPAIFDHMQAADEHRAMSVVGAMQQMLRTFENAAAAEGRAVAHAVEVCQSFDKTRDASEVAAVYKSGSQQPDSLTLDHLNLNRELHVAGDRSPKSQRRVGSVATVAMPETAAAAHEPEPEPEPEVTYTQAEMLYEFAGTNDGELATSQGEYVYLLEDDGSGWALISNNNGSQGYVPSSYYRLI